MAQKNYNPHEQKASAFLNELAATQFNLEGMHGGVQDAPIRKLILLRDDAPGSIRVIVERASGAPAAYYPPLAPTAGAFRKALECAFGARVSEIPQLPGNGSYIVEFKVDQEQDFARVTGALAPFLPKWVNMQFEQKIKETEIPPRPPRKWKPEPLRVSGRREEGPKVWDVTEVVKKTISNLITDTDPKVLARGTDTTPFLATPRDLKTGKSVPNTEPMSKFADADNVVFRCEVPTAVPTAAIMDALKPYFRPEGVTRQGNILQIPMGNFIPPEKVKAY